MTRTKDGIPYRKGMTLYSIPPRGSVTLAISSHYKTYSNGKDRWQTDGSPGGSGVISECYAYPKACIAEIVDRIDSQILRLKDERKSWLESLSK